MRYLILSDLHANLEATTAVLRDARGRGFDRAACLGDIVGYGASPNEVVDLLRALEPVAVVRGNHDKVAAGVDSGEQFSEIALQAALWTREALTAPNREWLASLPRGPLEVDGFLISHGTPVDEDAYLLSEEDARAVFESLAFPLAFFGHSHFACTFHAGEDGETIVELLAGEACRLEIEERRRYLVNPGSIGQPRDHDPRTAYALYDAEARAVTVHRVLYDVTEAQRKIASEGLPLPLAQRLEFGI
jgi:diadenosine tetraphosphatase ApaH/serine/threonine PP2A family protein phosphatase